MRMEHLEDGAPECPLVRLFDFNLDEIASRRRLFQDLADGSTTAFDLTAFPWLASMDGSRLTCAVWASDEGIKRLSQQDFQLRYTPDGFDDVAWRLEPFERGAFGFQWLIDVPTDVQLLLSPDGRW